MNEHENGLRKLAGKGLAILLCVLLLCIFFSGTLKTLTTPKVRLASLTSGKLKDVVTLTAVLHVREEITIGVEALPENVTMTVTAVYDAYPGQKVRAGQTLFAVEVTDHAKKMEALQTEYLQKGQTLLAMEQEPMTLLPSDEQWLLARDELHAAEKALLEMQLEGAEDEATMMQAQAAREAFLAADSIGVNAEACAWYSEKQRLEEERAALLESMKVLKELQARERVAAPQDGYILSMAVQAGSLYDGRQAAVTMSAGEDGFCLRAYTGSSPRTIAAGMTVLIPTSGKTLRTKVIDAGFDDFGRAYADIELKEDMVTALGGVAALLNSPVTVQVQYTAETASLQLPVSALRSDGMEEYVYVVQESENLFGAKVMKIAKQTVTVEDRTDTVVSVNGVARDAQVAYMEDKTLQDGMEVILYGTTP